VFQQSLVWRFGLIVFFHNLCPNSSFLNQFFVGKKEILVEIPLVPIKIINLFHLMIFIQSSVSDQFPHVRIVFLFDMGIVIFSIRSASRKLDIIRQAMVV